VNSCRFSPLRLTLVLISCVSVAHEPGGGSLIFWLAVAFALVGEASMFLEECR
jgi:hypothetical protein